MVAFQTTPMTGTSGYRVGISEGGPLSFGEVASRWEADPEFAIGFSRALAELPFAAYFFEMPPLTTDRMNHPFECVLIDSPALARRTADPRPFLQHLGGGEGGVVTFSNLGGDALLVVPEAVAAEGVYCHLAAFLRGAPLEQQVRLWRQTAVALSEQLCGQPRWVSTSGLGVSWLHIRVEIRPKYYVHRPYRRWDG